MALYQSTSLKRKLTNFYEATSHGHLPAKRPRYDNTTATHDRTPLRQPPYEYGNTTTIHDRPPLRQPPYRNTTAIHDHLSSRRPPHNNATVTNDQLASKRPHHDPPPSPIDKLPPELLHDIIAYTKTSLSATDPSFFPQALHSFCRTGQIPLYKLLRQVSKRWNRLFSPPLFDTLTICEYPDSWANVSKIATREPLKSYVRSIRFVPTPGFPKLEEVSEWCWRITGGYRHDENQKLFYVDSNDQIAALVGFRRTLPHPLLEIKGFANLEWVELPEKILWLWSREPHVLGVAGSKYLLGLFEEMKAERVKGALVDVKVEQKEELTL